MLLSTNICTGWTEAVPFLAKEQSLIVEGLEAIGQRLPFRIRGIDSDNDSAFINETLIKYCVDRMVSSSPGPGHTVATIRPGSSRRMVPW